VRLDDGAGDREAEPASGADARRAAVEGLEHEVALLLRDARAVVGDANLDPAVPRRDGDLDLSARPGVSRRVLDHVGERRVHLHRVDPHPGKVGADHRANLQSGEHVTEARDHRLHDVLERRELLLQRDVAGPGAREAEEVVDEPVQAVGLLEHGAEELLARLGVRTPRPRPGGS
jgi:hypothetical protein